ncbi:histidine--tRNA ligase [Candidatus Dependentiae bacterium]|nr:MAG: histidine--tRNA ligase [Candidatus Dependentiae bacterium]
MFKRVKGTQDFLDLSLFNFIVEQMKQHLQLYHFHEIATPIIEPTELFKRSLGLQTEIVKKEMFLIDVGKGEESICLRPEATAPIVRAFVENGIQTTPWKVFTYGPMFRYERPQKGRYRQFHQITIEAIGVHSIGYDAQIIKMLDCLFHEILTLNNYALQLNFLGCIKDREAYLHKLYTFLEKHADTLCNLCLERKEKNIMRVFDCKNSKCQEIFTKAPKLIDNLCDTCAQEWQQLRDDLDLLAVSYLITPTLVRGLDYYNKTVFEFISHNLGAQKEFCGGGRYDQLVREVGGKEDQPSVGAGIGIERLMLLLEPIKNTLPLPELPALHVIIPMSEKQQLLALLVSNELHIHKLCTDVLLDGDSLKGMLRKANKMGAAYCLILGEEEQRKHEVTIKNMMTGEEKRIPQSEAATYLMR